jgi:hypothetical protein
MRRTCPADCPALALRDHINLIKGLILQSLCYRQALQGFVSIHCVSERILLHIRRILRDIQGQTRSHVACSLRRACPAWYGTIDRPTGGQRLAWSNAIQLSLVHSRQGPVERGLFPAPPHASPSRFWIPTFLLTAPTDRHPAHLARGS